MFWRSQGTQISLVSGPNSRSFSVLWGDLWNRGRICVFLKYFILPIDLTGVLSLSLPLTCFHFLLWNISDFHLCISHEEVQYSIQFCLILKLHFGSLCNEKQEDLTTMTSSSQRGLHKIILLHHPFPGCRGEQQGNVLGASVYSGRDSLLSCF